MPSKTHSRASLVIVELGAAWPAALVGADARTGCRVLAEVEGEGPLAFAARVEDFTLQAFPRGTELELAVVACNQRADETAEVARRAMAGCLLPQIARAGSLFFSAADSASDRFRRRLTDLVADFERSGALHGRIQAYFAEEASRTASTPAATAGPRLASDAVARVA